MVNIKNHLKISHHQYSGRLRPHEHTSYLPLALLIVMVGMMLARLTVTALADRPQPQSGSIGLTGSVVGPPPTAAPSISSPTDQQHFRTTPIKVYGNCPTSTLIEIFKNNIFAGSTPCDSNGTYSLDVDLVFGQNSLTAQAFDALNQAGPVSKPVVVFYDTLLPQAAPAGLFITGNQLILQTDAAFRGSFPSQNLNVPVTVIGGTAPYAINVQWGDTNNQVIARSDNSTFNTTHAYDKPGTYKITLQGTDSKQLVAFLSVAAIVNGQPSVIASTATPKSLNKIIVLWPILAIAATMVASFWFGEHREKKILSSATKSQNPTFGIMS